MRIEQIDSNFNTQKKAESTGQEGYVIPHPAFGLHGVFYDDEQQCFTRMDLSIAAQVSEGVGVLARHTSGGRLCFSTNSTLLALRVTYGSLGWMHHMPLTGSSGFSLFEVTAKGEKFLFNFAPGAVNPNGFNIETKLAEGMRNYVLYFPLYNDVKRLEISLSEGACVTPFNPYKKELPILYYGSSITQGGCSSRPDTCYQPWICRWTGVDYINLGFSGNAKGEDLMTDYLAGIECSVFVCDYDHNAPTVEHLQNTHYRLYERYRAARPNAPILFISRPDYYRDDTGAAREQIIRETYLKAKKLGDKKVYFLSGKKFYKNRQSAEFSVDAIHPTDRGFYRMAEVIYRKLKSIKP